MGELKLITPIEGQKNWGNAINGNFKLLLNKYNSLLSEIATLKTLVNNSTGVFNIQQDHFLYITNTGITLHPNADWNDLKEGTIFEPNSKIESPAWFVKTIDDGVTYNGYTWNTGDLLIVRKINANGNHAIQQITGLMGGYLYPETYEVDGKNITTIYRNVPSISTISQYEFTAPFAYWIPQGYDAKKGEITYNLGYWNGISSTLIGESISIPARLTTSGLGSYFQIGREDDPIISIQLPEGVDDVGFTINFSHDNNLLYFSYTYEIVNNMLTIEFDRASYNEDSIDVRVNIFYKE